MIGGFSTGIVTAQSYFDVGNTAFGPTWLLSVLGPYSGGFSGSGSTPFSTTDPFSLTMLADVTYPAGMYRNSSSNAVLRAPEPETVGSLGAGLLFLGAGVARRRRAT